MSCFSGQDSASTPARSASKRCAPTHGVCRLVSLWDGHVGQVSEVRPFISKAFPGVDSVVLDSEILLVDSKGDLVKFGSLGGLPPP